MSPLLPQITQIIRINRKERTLLIRPTSPSLFFLSSSLPSVISSSPFLRFSISQPSSSTTTQARPCALSVISVPPSFLRLRFSVSIFPNHLQVRPHRLAPALSPSFSSLRHFSVSVSPFQYFPIILKYDHTGSPLLSLRHFRPSVIFPSPFPRFPVSPFPRFNISTIFKYDHTGSPLRSLRHFSPSVISPSPFPRFPVSFLTFFPEFLYIWV